MAALVAPGRARSLALVLGVAMLGTLSATGAALADPPWARGGGYRHGGPPPWAPAHGWRRHHEGWGGGPYRAMRFRSERRSFGYRY